MIGDGGVRGVLTALFAVLAAWYLVAAVRPLLSCGRDPRHQVVGSGLHVLLSAAMVSMFWSWGNDIPVIALVTLFTAAAGWFAGQAVFGPGGGSASGAGGSYAASPAVNWGHAGMMGAMVWMAVLMPLTSGVAVASVPSATSVPAAAGGAMAGMDMGGQASTGTTIAPVTTAGSPGWTGTVCLVLAAALFALAAWRSVTGLSLLAAPDHDRPAGPAGRPGSLLSEGAVALMAAGMAVALLQMA